ncbi:hypothetical protein [Sulfitobacter geojensis]|uniref:hypothetical protein n=1 Tax=Sulfitobacter geojensis TaxID=1342299 RepID=UPI001939AA37|nr:hypothetical protein [Sulfitobacter geojensis]MBM1764079.1 hypothetical protein [Sulfitobacter geojensis]MBM1780435.1 hypothetical protein [Sulfitobacter geojensis]MBM1792610.1 hypothetical protein [Sulfitobacter geojensis]MBM1829811.1 hypothetical protein [Sulfitobacter geojensis]
MQDIVEGHYMWGLRVWEVGATPLSLSVLRSENGSIAGNFFCRILGVSGNALPMMAQVPEIAGIFLR